MASSSLSDCGCAWTPFQCLSEPGKAGEEIGKKRGGAEQGREEGMKGREREREGTQPAFSRVREERREPGGREEGMKPGRTEGGSREVGRDRGGM
eukprot:3936217-Rhodomonas_salina.1